MWLFVFERPYIMKLDCTKGCLLYDLIDLISQLYFVISDKVHGKKCINS